MVWVCSVDLVAMSAYGSEGVTVGSGARIAAVTETSRVEVTVRGGLDEATEDGRVSVVLVTGATMVGTRTKKSRGVGCPMSSLKVAPKLLDTGVSVTNIDSD